MHLVRVENSDTKRLSLFWHTWYISDSMTYICPLLFSLNKISLQFWRQTSGFRPGRAHRVSTSDYNIEQPEIWPPKPEIVIQLELQQIASKFQRQVRDFRPWWARIKWLRQWPTTGNGSVTNKTGNTYISGTMTDRMAIATANLGFSTTLSAKKLTPGDCDNDRQPEMPLYTFWAPMLQFLVVGRCRNNLAHLVSSASSSKIPNLAFKFRRYLS